MATQLSRVAYTSMDSDVICLGGKHQSDEAILRSRTIETYQDTTENLWPQRSHRSHGLGEDKTHSKKANENTHSKMRTRKPTAKCEREDPQQKSKREDPQQNLNEKTHSENATEKTHSKTANEKTHSENATENTHSKKANEKTHSKMQREDHERPQLSIHPGSCRGVNMSSPGNPLVASNSQDSLPDLCTCGPSTFW